jgi:hypothetical protein
LRDEITTLFGAENAVDKNVGIFVGHGPTIRISRIRVCDGCHIVDGFQKVPSLNGTRDYLFQSPGTAVPGFHMPCLRHWSIAGCKFASDGGAVSSGTGMALFSC